jgi:hypothetical protein
MLTTLAYIHPYPIDCRNQPEVTMDNSTAIKKTAKLTGLLYFLLALAAIYSYMYVSPKIMAVGDMTATAKKMLDNEFLFRTTIASDIITNILFVLVIILLYRLFRQVNEILSLSMAGLAFVAIPVAFIGEALRLIALEIFKGNLMKSFSTEQVQDVSATLLKIGNFTGQLVTFHWGLWLIPMGWLVYKSGFIPKILGILLFVNGLGYMISSMTFILFPEWLSAVSKIVYPTYFVGELPLIFWLMIKGIRSNPKLNTTEWYQGIQEPTT